LSLVRFNVPLDILYNVRLSTNLTLLPYAAFFFQRFNMVRSVTQRRGINHQKLCCFWWHPN